MFLTSIYNTAFNSSSPHHIKSTNQNTFSELDKEEKTNQGFIYCGEIKPTEVREESPKPQDSPKDSEK